MLKLKKTVNTPLVVPDYMAKSVNYIDYKMLKKQGVKYLAFDADSTLVHYKSKRLDPETLKVLKAARAMFDDWCLASNRFKLTLGPIATDLEAHIVSSGLFTRKPRKRYFKKIINHFDAKPEQIAMVGDKVVADIWGANRMGLVSVWVERLGPDGIWDQLLGTRRKEAKMMKVWDANQ